MYNRDFKKSYKKLFYTSFGKYMRRNISQYNIKNKWLNYKTNVKPIYLRLNTSHISASINIDIQCKDVEIQYLYYKQFKELKFVFENILGKDWDWNFAYKNEYSINYSRITKSITNVNIYDKNTWPTIFIFFEKNLLKFDLFWKEFNEIFKQLED